MTDLSAPRTTSDSLLRLAMRADAVLSGLSGAAILLAAGPLSDLTGYSRALAYGIGAAFVVMSAGMFWAASLDRVRPGGIALAAGNLAFTVVTVLVVLARPVDLTTAGVVITLATGVYTLVIADLQYLGLRRMRR